MKRKIIYSFAALLALLVFFGYGCTKDFEEINTDPNILELHRRLPICF